jgi:YidC/Oxa1 family membrane protein insertase
LNFINIVLGIPLGFIIYYAYRVTGNYGIAILLFALAVKIVLFPVNIITHKNSIRFLKLQPSLDMLKRRYSGDIERINEEQYNLFQKEKYNPFIGIIPLFIQLFLVIGMLQVMYHPLQHMLHLDKSVIDVLIQTARNIYGIHEGGGEQLLILETIQELQNISIFQQALSGFSDGKIILQLLENTNLNFINLNLGEVPSIIKPSLVLMITLLSGITSLVFCIVQNVLSPGAIGQNRGTKLGLTVFTVAFSFYFTFVTPAGVGLYWTAGNILGIAVLFILNLLYNPKKLAVEALQKIKASRKTPAQIREKRKRNKALLMREKIDVAKFNTAKKQLVFYALSGGQYKFYKEIIEYLLEHSGIIIHYLTNDPDDAVFSLNNGRLIPYYAGHKKTISLMLKLDTDIMATTVPDLQSYHMKRSVVRDDIEYIYIPHESASTHLTGKETAFDHFDTIFCVGPHQVAELRRREELANLSRKNLVKTGYGLYDQLTASYMMLPKKNNDKPKILIAPSWQADNILELCIDDMLKALAGHGFTIIVRPHPQSIRMFPEQMEALTARYSKYTADGEITFELDFSSNDSIFSSDILISDWSGIAFEFSYCTLNPCIFVNTPMKIMNPNYEKYGLEVLDISLRNKVGVSINVEDIKDIGKSVERLLAEKDSFKKQIQQCVEKYLFYPNRNGEAGGKYIKNQLNKRTYKE